LSNLQPRASFAAIAHDRFWQIVLQNSFLGCVQNFAGALVRSLENYVGGHMINPIFNRQPS